MSATTETITISCPHCGQHLAIDESMRDMELICPTCRKTFSAMLPSVPEITVVRKGSPRHSRLRNVRKLSVRLAIIGIVALFAVKLVLAVFSSDLFGGGIAVRVTIPRMGPDQELYNEIVYLNDLVEKNLGQVQVAQEVLSQYSLSRMTSETRQLAEGFSSALQEVDALERQKSNLHSSRQARIDQAKNAGMLSGASTALGIGSALDEFGRDSDGEGGIGLLGAALIGIAGAAIGSENKGNQVATQIDSEIHDISRRQRQVLQSFATALWDYRKTHSFAAFDAGSIFDPQSRGGVCGNSVAEYIEKNPGFSRNASLSVIGLLLDPTSTQKKQRLVASCKPVLSILVESWRDSYRYRIPEMNDGTFSEALESFGGALETFVDSLSGKLESMSDAEYEQTLDELYASNETEFSELGLTKEECADILAKIKDLGRKGLCRNVRGLLPFVMEVSDEIAFAEVQVAEFSFPASRVRSGYSAGKPRPFHDKRKSSFLKVVVLRD